MGHHHGLDAVQPPGKQAQEAVLLVRVQHKAEGPLGQHRRRGVASVAPGQLGSRRWRRMLEGERRGPRAPGKRGGRGRGGERQKRDRRVNDGGQVEEWLRGQNTGVTG